jgi:hypothetical protein
MTGGVITIGGLLALLVLAGEVMLWMCTPAHAPDEASGAVEGGVAPDALEQLRGTGAL